MYAWKSWQIGLFICYYTFQMVFYYWTILIRIYDIKQVSSGKKNHIKKGPSFRGLVVNAHADCLCVRCSSPWQQWRAAPGSSSLWVMALILLVHFFQAAFSQSLIKCRLWRGITTVLSQDSMQKDYFSSTLHQKKFQSNIMQCNFNVMIKFRILMLILLFGQ